MIHVEGLTKKFKVYNAPSLRLKEILLRRSFHNIYTALENVNFHVDDGQTLGIIGPNGAGKSTLLKLLSGILLPDMGTISISGKVTGLLELGTGFNPEMTGRANIYMNGLLLGMENEEIRAKEDRIIKFTELESFMDNPLKTFSSGMTMRLAFAIAYHAEPSCFLVGEALSVGDAHFQQKCMKAIKNFKEGGGSIVFVSHDLNSVKLLCDKAILLSRGRTIEEGDSENVVNSYNFLISQIDDEEVPRRNVLSKGNITGTDYGTKQIRITSVSVKGEASGSSVVCSGERTVIEVAYTSLLDMEELTIGILIRDRFGQDIFGTNTFHAGVTARCEENHRYVCRFAMDMNLGPGKYSVTAALHTEDIHVASCFNWIDKATDFEVAGIKNGFFTGVARLNPEISCIPYPLEEQEYNVFLQGDGRNK